MKSILKLLIWTQLIWNISCASMIKSRLSKISAGYIGCNHQDITIKDEDISGSIFVWEAECQGQKFVCNGIFENQSATFSCSKKAVTVLEKNPEEKPSLTELK